MRMTFEGPLIRYAFSSLLFFGEMIHRTLLENDLNRVSRAYISVNCHHRFNEVDRNLHVYIDSERDVQMKW